MGHAYRLRLHLSPRRCGIATFTPDLIRYSFATSAERARITNEVIERNPPMAELLMDLEADPEQRAMLETELLQG